MNIVTKTGVGCICDLTLLSPCNVCVGEDGAVGVKWAPPPEDGCGAR